MHEAERASLEVLLPVRMVERRGEAGSDQQGEAERQRPALGTNSIAMK